MSPSARRPFAAREQRMCPERLVHNRERAGGKRVLARQACPTARCAASCRPCEARPGGRWRAGPAAAWSAPAAARPPIPRRTAAAPAGRPTAPTRPRTRHADAAPGAVTPARTARRRGGRPSRRTRRERRRPAAAMTRSSATRPPRPSSCTCRECFCLRVWEFSGFCGRPVRACTWIGRVRARACVHMVYSAPGISIIVHRLCRSGAMWSCRQERAVKPSAQPTLVRTQHLPPPA